MRCICYKGVSACKQKSVESVLLGVIFENKSQEEQEEILIYIYANWHQIQQNSLVIEALKNTKFVTSADGHLCKPKDLFDTGDALLASLFSGDGEAHKFPGKRFGSVKWLKILRKTGLRNTCDADILLQCARRIEFLGAESMKDTDHANTESQVPLEIWSLAKALIKSVFQKTGLLHDQNFCNAFGKIACVPAEKFYIPEIRGKKDKRVVCSYSDAILLKDWPLAWTSAPILTIESMVPPDYSWGALQLRSPPPITAVLKHLQPNGSNIRAYFLNCVENTCMILKYLDTNWSALSSSDVSKLSNIPFISNENGVFTAAACTFVTLLKINLSPIANELPSSYLPFVRILKELGLHDTLSISSALMILSRRPPNSLKLPRVLYYVNRSCTCMLIAEPPDYMPVLDLVAFVVSRVLGSPVPLPIGSLLSCPHDSETEAVNILKLSPPDERDVFLGKEILLQDALQVQLNPLRPFYKGEIVAWQTQNGEKLKYGRIVEDVRPLAGHALYRLSLETSPLDTKKTIISSHVFWFRNFCNSYTYRHAIKELEHGRVPAKEFVEAVEEMFSATGTNKDMDMQRLHQNTLSLQERLKESHAAIVREQEKSEIARSEVQAAEVALLCRICFTSEIDICVVPCGHALCHQCASSVSRCPYCRVQFSTAIRIHRS